MIKSDLDKMQEKVIDTQKEREKITVSRQEFEDVKTTIREIIQKLKTRNF